MAEVQDSENHTEEVTTIEEVTKSDSTGKIVSTDDVSGAIVVEDNTVSAWACPACTLQNEAGTLACTVCMTPNPSLEALTFREEQQRKSDEAIAQLIALEDKERAEKEKTERRRRNRDRHLKKMQAAAADDDFQVSDDEELQMELEELTGLKDLWQDGHKCFLRNLAAYLSRRFVTCFSHCLICDTVQLALKRPFAHRSSEHWDQWGRFCGLQKPRLC